MRALFLVALVALPAHADLYRWVDPQSGTVKLSNLPPADAAIRVEVLPYRGPGGAPVQPVRAKPDPGAVATLEARWRSLLAELAVLPERPDFERGGEGLRRHLEEYEAASAELDRVDPAGAKRRQAETAGLLERLSKLLPQ